MEGVGPRLGRASSRYGPSTGFSGPVRKWKKQWVHVSPSSSSNFSYRNNTYSSRSRSHNNGNNKASALLLCRWTPISPSASADRNSTEEPPTRKFRYTPVWIKPFVFGPPLMSSVLLCFALLYFVLGFCAR